MTLEGHFVSGYAGAHAISDSWDAPAKLMEPVSGAVCDANSVLEEDATARCRFERVSDLVKGFGTPFGLELLATVHWVVTRDGAASADEAIKLTYRWNDRKRQFTEHQIRLAHDVLSSKGWLH